MTDTTDGRVNKTDTIAVLMNLYYKMIIGNL